MQAIAGKCDTGIGQEAPVVQAQGEQDLCAAGQQADDAVAARHGGLRRPGRVRKVVLREAAVGRERSAGLARGRHAGVAVPLPAILPPPRGRSVVRHVSPGKAAVRVARVIGLRSAERRVVRRRDGVGGCRG